MRIAHVDREQIRPEVPEPKDSEAKENDKPGEEIDDALRNAFHMPDKIAFTAATPLLIAQLCRRAITESRILAGHPNVATALWTVIQSNCLHRDRPQGPGYNRKCDAFHPRSETSTLCERSEVRPRQTRQTQIMSSTCKSSRAQSSHSGTAYPPRTMPVESA